MHKPDFEKIKKYRPVIALSVLTLTLLIIFLPKLGGHRGRIAASGTIEVREIELASRIPSRVVRIDAVEGTSVSNGATVITLDDRLVNAQRASAEALLVNAQDSFSRSSSLYASGSIARQQYEQSKALYDKAEADFEQADLMAAEARVSAPWDGVVLRTHVEEGELVAAMTPLATFGDMKHAKIRIYVGMRELARIKQGQQAFIRIDALPRVRIRGTVATISEKAEFTPKTIQTRDERIKEVFAVEVIADNPDGILKPGMPADVELVPADSGARKKK